MRKNLFLWLRRCQFPLLLLMGFMPLILISVCTGAPQALETLWLPLAGYMVCAGGCLLAPAAKRLICAGFCAAVLFALSLIFLPINAHPLLLLLPAGLTALLFFSLPLAARHYEAEIPPFVYFSGIFIHALVQFLNHYFTVGNGGVSPYAPVSSALNAAFIVYVLLFLLSMNRISLDNASLSRHRIPAGMRAVNTGMTILFIAASLLLSVTPAIIRGITALWQTLCGAVVRFFAFLLSLLPASDDPGMNAQGGMNDFMSLGGNAPQTSPFAVFLERIASVITMIILIVGIVIFLRLLAGLIMRLIRHAAARLRTYMSAASAEYEDEITDTREDGAQREIRFLFRRSSISSRYDDTPAGRIRFSYARLMRRNPKWSANSTARENLPKAAAALYERARYSEHPLSGEDAERFAEHTRRL